MVVFQLLFAGLGAVVTAVGVAYLRAYWKLRGIDPTDVIAVSADQEGVELEGRAYPVGEAYQAPFSGTDAILCEWSAERYDTRGDDSSWRTIDSGQEYAPFLLDDGTGEIVVDPNGAEWTLDRDFDVQTDPESQPPLEIRRYLEDTSVDSLYRTPEDERRTEKRRYRERRLDAGEEVYVYGPVREGPIRGVPDTEGRPVIKSDQAAAEPAVEGRATTMLTPGILPGVGDPEETFSLGAAGEVDIFTISDSGEAAAQRKLLKRGAMVTVFGLFVVVMVVLVLLFGEPTNTAYALL